MKIARRTAVKLGLAAGLAPALGQAAWAEPSVSGSFRLMQGPMIGAVGPDRVKIFMRASARTSAAIAYGTRPDLSDARTSPAHAMTPEGDYVAHVELTGLSSATRYYYRPLLNGEPDRYLARTAPFSFRTAPRAGARTAFSVAFGSCARIQAHPVQPIWDAVASTQPDLFLWLGDNVYHDTLEPEIMDEMWRWQRNLPNLQPLLRSTPQLAIWDDHDSGLNDHDRTNPVKDAALTSFKRYWANPAYGLPDAPGVFFKFSYAHVDFFMLDGRYYRDPNAAEDGAQKSMLGAWQRDWLKAELAASRAVFKVVACGSGWSSAKGPGGDSWAAFLHERNALFDFIRDERIGGVVLLSGDTHVGELNAIPWSDRGGYDLYDLVSSPLAQETERSWVNRRPEIRIRQVYASDVNFGLLRFDDARAPTLTYALMNARGQQAFDPLTLTPADLANGVRSWPTKIDAQSAARKRNEDEGRGYYSPL